MNQSPKEFLIDNQFYNSKVVGAYCENRDPYRAYSWFVGAAPVEQPEVAIAVLIVNEPKWRIKSGTAAALVLQKYFELARGK